jgi:Legume lectin domain/Putative amidase domain
MRHQRLFAIFGLMATLCLGLGWVGSAAWGAPPPRPNKDALAQMITPTYAPAAGTPTATYTPSGPAPLAPPLGLPIDYPNFATTNLLLFVGAAAANGTEIRLQDAYNSHVPGVVWALSRQSIGNGFETTFQFRISRNGNSGGDGFAFVLQNSGMSATGGSGCDLGYGGINNSLIIEFDTYPNNYISGACPWIADPNDNHVGLLRNGNPIHSVDSPAAVLNNITLEDGAVHTVNIAYVASTETLTVQIDGNLVATFQTSLNGIGLTDGMAWVGFTSGQGFARQDIDILSWYFNRQAQTPTPTVTPTQTSTPTLTPTPINCPWGGTASTSRSGYCEYTFNPEAAASYARAYSARACIFFCKFTYPGVAGAQDCAPAPSTDCANFVSQALLYGGLPLTRAWHCRWEGDPNPVCVRSPQNWSGAIYRSFPPTTPTPDLAQLKTYQLPAYFIWLAQQNGTATPSFTRANAVEMTLPHPNPFPYPPISPNEKANRVVTAKAVGQKLSQAGFGVGDIMFTTVTNKQHVAIVVAWGPALSTWGELRYLYNEIQDDTAELTSVRTSLNTVPYVIDHGPHGDFAYRNPAFTNNDLLTLPKPYYALEWPVHKTSNVFVEINMRDLLWGFVKVAPIMSFSPDDLMKEGAPAAADESYALFTRSQFTLACPVY